MVKYGDAVKLQLLIERLKAAEAKLLLRVVKEAENTINELLSGKELAELSRVQLVKALTISNGKLTFLGNTIIQQYRTALTDFARKQTLLENKLFGNGKIQSPDAIEKILYEIPLGIDVPGRGMTIDVYLETWWKNIRQSLFGTVNRNAFEKKSNLQIRREIIGSKTSHYKDGLLDSFRRNAVSTSNTSIQHAATIVREAIIALSGTGVLWSSLLERNTCARCRSLDGRYFPQGTGPRPPVHTSCRCLAVPASPSDSLPRESYYDWLKSQDVKFINEVLGPSRASLFLRGGITPQEFSDLQLDRRFEPLTLQDLHKLAPSIFSSAGL